MSETETYSITTAVNLSSDENNYYYVYEQGEYLVIINQHISLWRKTNGELQFIMNILHRYHSSNSNLEPLGDGKFQITTEECPLIILANYDNYLKSVGFSDLTTLKFKRVSNLCVPDSVSDWQETTTKAVLKFNDIHVLIENNLDDSNFFEHELFDYLFQSPNLYMTKRMIGIIENYYREKMDTGIDSVFH